MSLTNEELAELEKLLTQRRRAAWDWKFGRWVIVVGGLFFLLTAAYMSVWQWPRTFQAWEELGRIPWSHPVHRVDLEILELRGDLQTAKWEVLTLCKMQFYVLSSAMIGSFLLASGLAHWRKDKRDVLLIKMAQTYLEEQRAKLPGAVRDEGSQE